MSQREILRVSLEIGTKLTALAAELSMTRELRAIQASPHSNQSIPYDLLWTWNQDKGSRELLAQHLRNIGMKAAAER